MMSSSINYQKLDVNQTRSFASIADNDLSKLMYYLACVFAVVQYEGAERYTKYRQYDTLTSEDEKAVLNLVSLFNPKVMVDNYLFLVGQRFVTATQSNQFFQLSDSRLGFRINSEVIIGGVSRKILKVMGCNEYWLNTYYYNPVQSYNSRPLPLMMEDNNIEENIQYLSQNNQAQKTKCEDRLERIYSALRYPSLCCLCDAHYTRKCKRIVGILIIVFYAAFFL